MVLCAVTSACNAVVAVDYCGHVPFCIGMFIIHLPDQSQNVHCDSAIHLFVFKKMIKTHLIMPSERLLFYTINSAVVMIFGTQTEPCPYPGLVQPIPQMESLDVATHGKSIGKRCKHKVHPGGSSNQRFSTCILIQLNS